MKIGLTEPSDIQEKIVKVDEKTAIRYKVVEERINLGANVLSVQVNGATIS